jgi:hypothetical protein
VYNVALASLPRFTLAGDNAASARYHLQDVVGPDFALHDDSTLGVPAAPGFGVAPDPAGSAAVTERQEVFTEGQGEVMSRDATTGPGGARPRSPVTGSPAIQPRWPATTGTTPGFTVDDVAQYTKLHGFAGGPTASGDQPAITKVMFIGAGEANMLLGGEDVARPDDYLVCYVELSGPFLLSGMSVPPGVKIPTVQTAFEVFDAHTGNLLVFGGR